MLYMCRTVLEEYTKKKKIDDDSYQLGKFIM